jgi:hypothetical protein
MMRGMLRANLGFLMLVTIGVSACASLRPYDPGPGKRVVAFFPKETYKLGEPVNVTIANLSEVALFYPNNFCKAKLQKQSGASWTTVSEPKDGCPIALGFLDPGQTVVHSFQVPQDLGGVQSAGDAAPISDWFSGEQSARDCSRSRALLF